MTMSTSTTAAFRFRPAAAARPAFAAFRPAARASSNWAFPRPAPARTPRADARAARAKRFGQALRDAARTADEAARDLFLGELREVQHLAEEALARDAPAAPAAPAADSS